MVPSPSAGGSWTVRSLGADVLLCPMFRRSGVVKRVNLKSGPTLTLTTTGLRRKTRTPNASAKCEVATPKATLKHCCQKKGVSPSTPTCRRRTPSFRSRRNTQEQGNTKHNQNRKPRREDEEDPKFLCGLCLSDNETIGDTAAQFIK